MAGWPEGPIARRSVLVVEDYAPFRRVLTRLLAGDGWRVLEAASGPEAVSQALARRPELVIVDWCLGGPLDGLDVLRALRRGGRACRAPVVVLSAVRDHADDESAALGAGAALFFSKLEVVSCGAAFLRHLDAAVGARPSVLALGGGFHLDPATGLLLGPGHEATLNPQEALLLEALARARGGLISHERLWDMVWSSPCLEWRHVLNNRISTLRRKSGSLAGRLMCKKGEGFLLQTAD